MEAPSPHPAIILALTISILRLERNSAGADVQEVCQWEKFSATCSVDEVIVIESSHYGRMKEGRCILLNLGFVGCSKNVLNLTDSLCSGQRRCQIQVPSSELDKMEPCVQDLKSYLEISYSCKRVILPEAKGCRSLKFSRLSNEHGFLSNLVTAETGCGSVSSPWLIEAKSGQRINITLWNFGIEKATSLVQSFSSNSCIKYATLTEIEHKQSKMVCGEFSRISHVYTSIGNALDVRIYSLPSTPAEATYFLLEYQIVGCVDPDLPDGFTYRRQGASATVGCEASTNTWTLECEGSRWKGAYGTCSGKAISESTFQFPSVLSIIVIISISLLIGLLILSLGMLYLCRRQRNGSHVVMQPAPIDPMMYNQNLISKSMTDSLPMNITNNILHSCERESNDYASIWEWPMPIGGGPSSAAAAADPEGSIPESYQGRLITGSTQEKPEHPYQLPGVSSSTTTTPTPYMVTDGYERTRDVVCSTVDPRYFDVDPMERQMKPPRNLRRETETDAMNVRIEGPLLEGRGSN